MSTHRSLPHGPSLEPAAPIEERLDDRHVVSRILGGELELFEVIMRRNNQRLFRAARSIVGSDEEAEDVLQESYVLAFAALQRFEGRAQLSTWLGRIVIHEAYRRMRRQRREPPTETEDHRADRSLSPEAVVSGQRMARLLDEAIDTLPEVYRTVFVLRVVERMNVAETAECLDIPVATVKTRLYRARRLLAQELEARHDHALGDVHRFLGTRCDRTVAQVLERLRALHG